MASKVNIVIYQDAVSDTFHFQITFSFDGKPWRGTGTCPDIESAFDEAMEYLENTVNFRAA